MKIYLPVIFVIAILFLFRKKKYRYENELRKCESPIETKLVEALYKKGYQPYTQVPVGKYRLDIALYINRKKYCIECDGKEFHTHPDQIKHDKIRDRYVMKKKWKVLRFTGSEINSQLNWCLKVIENRTK